MKMMQLQFGCRKPSANRGGLARRLSALAMSLLLVCSLPLAAFADTWYLDDGDITVNATESGQTVSQGAKVDVPDSTPVITQKDSSTTTDHTVTINADAGATANVTLKDVNIDVHNTGDPASGRSGKAAVQIIGNGDVTIELDGTNTVQSGAFRAGVEKNTIAPTGSDPGSGNGNLTITDENETTGSLKATGGQDASGIGGGDSDDGSNITITGSAKVTANGGHGSAGIGGGDEGSGSNITITGSAKVTANGGSWASGIGGGDSGNGSNITITGSAEVNATAGFTGAGIGGGNAGDASNISISQDAQVKAQGGNAAGVWGTGAAIGDGGRNGSNGQEVEPDTSKLTPNGMIEYYNPGENMNADTLRETMIGTYVPSQPTEPVQPSQPEEAPAQPLYRVVGKDGKGVSCETERKDGVLTITVDEDFASLSGYLWGIQTLKAQGIDTIVFVTNGVTSTFALADLMSSMTAGDSYTLTHDGSTVTFTLATGTDISSILK